MSWLSRMTPVRYFRLFWGYAGARILVMFGLTMLMGWAEALGLTLFFPLFTVGQSSPTDSISRTFVRVFHALGLEPTPTAALPLIAGIYALKGLLTYATTMYQDRLARNVIASLRLQVLEAAGRVDYKYATRANAADNAHVMVNEVSRAALGFQQYLRSIPPFINATVLFAIVALIDWRSTLVCVLMGSTLVFAVRVSGRVASHHSSVYSSHMSRLTGLIVQTFQAFKYLRTTGTFSTFEKQVTAASEQALDASLRASSAGVVIASVLQPIMVLFLSGLLYYRTSFRGESLASLFVVLLYFVRIMSELMVLQSSWQLFCSYIPSVEGVSNRLLDDRKHVEHNGTRPFAGLREALRCDQVSFAYAADRPVLHDVTLSIQRHTTVAFVGASGSGKSTLVDLLLGTLKPDTGSVEVDDIALCEIDVGTLRRHVGYVPQEAVLFDDSIANNIALWRPDVDRAAVERAAKNAHAAEFIETLASGYDAPVGDRGVMLSGGQRQRLAIARELVKSPELLVLDEATSALDSASERAIQASIDSLRGTMTILIIAHRLSTIRNVDRIYVLHDGRIIEDGRYEELVAKGGRFRQMVELQQLGTA